MCSVYALFFVMFVRSIVGDNAVMYDLSNVRCFDVLWVFSESSFEGLRSVM